MKKRVVIPFQDVAALLELATKVRAKHLADGEASPLKVLNWEAINPHLDQALYLEELAQKLKREKRLAFQKRNSKVRAVLNLVRNSRDVLAGVHSEEMKMLGNWGFDVLEPKINVSEDFNKSKETV